MTSPKHSLLAGPTMHNDIIAISDFVQSNRKALSAYLRQKLIVAGANTYLDQLGKAGIEQQEDEAAGVLLDLACALLRRLHPDQQYQPEAILPQLPEAVAQRIRLPRSPAYHAACEELLNKKEPT